MHQDGDTGLPVLLMELMNENLTHFLESSTQSIPYHIQVNTCHDIAMALSFLHLIRIIHECSFTRQCLSQSDRLWHGRDGWAILILKLLASPSLVLMCRLYEYHSYATHYSILRSVVVSELNS